ncbi:MAG TPA: tetratricopeptide repeat protein [Planctomycetota bacterium]|nr:tetratricopeptide repeat protein [Planctomycetota bacterium]
MTAALLVLLLVHEDLELQIAELTRRMEREGASAELYYRRAELHRFHEDWPAARADYDRAERLDPGLAEVDLGRGRMWLGAGSPDRAEAALVRFLSRRPDHAGALLERARARRALGRPAEAARDYTRALARLPDPKPDFFLERARAQEEAGDLAGALAGLEEGMKRLGRIVTLESAALELEIASGRLDEALARLERLAAGTPRPEPWLVRRGEVLRRAGRAAEAEAAFRAALAALETLPPARRAVKSVRDLEARARAGLSGKDP